VTRRKAWATAVLIGWAVTTIAVWLLTPADPTKSATLIIQQALLIAAIPCVLVGGPVAAVALRFASQQDIRRARLRG